MNELLLKPVIKVAFDYLLKMIPAAKDKLSVDLSELEASLSQHIKTVDNWSASIGFRDSNGTKLLESSIFDLNLSLTIKRHNYQSSQKTDCRMSDLLEFPGNVIILGDPGAGKTTTTKYAR